MEIASGDAMTGDQFLLASDGLTRVVDDSELAAVLASRPPEEAADQLVETVLSRGAPDNVTIIITKLV
jgi:serine/threonine protein phosphatase PrpC